MADEDDDEENNRNMKLPNNEFRQLNNTLTFSRGTIPFGTFSAEY